MPRPSLRADHWPVPGSSSASTGYRRFGSIGFHSKTSAMQINPIVRRTWRANGRLPTSRTARRAPAETTVRSRSPRPVPRLVEHDGQRLQHMADRLV
jgi:hypothetical protein